MAEKKKQKKNIFDNIVKKVSSSGFKRNKNINKETKTTKSKKLFHDVKLDKIKKVLIRKKNIKIKKISNSENEEREINYLKLEKSQNNPIISPSLYNWESEGTFNPAAILIDDLFHIFYRAMGPDGISRIGYACSKDGIIFDERLCYPVYVAQEQNLIQKHNKFTSPARLVFDPSIYTSGGGWGGCEDPRIVAIDGYLYMTLNIFNGWDSIRVGVTSIKISNIFKKNWKWEGFSYLSKIGDRQKNWVLFPEKINNKFVLFYNLDNGDPKKVSIGYINELNSSETPEIGEALDPQKLPDHEVAWHYRTRSAACPPLKTKDGWVLLYHAMQKSEPSKYKVGVLLLDLKDPEKVLYRAKNPILEPEEWYENDYKKGVVYVTGSVIKNDILYVYYGGGDKHVCVATIPVYELIRKLKEDKIIKLKNIKK